MPASDLGPSLFDKAGRITLFISGLGGGGAERVMLTLAEAFSERGYAVDLVVSNARGRLLADVPDSVRLVDFGARRIMASLPALVRYFRTERPAVMLSALSPANCLAVWARQLSGVRTRLILSEHNHISLASRNAGSKRARLMPVLMRLAYPKADGIVAVSCGVADDLASTINLARRKISVIYNPIVTSRMLDLSRETVAHHWFDDGQLPVILGVGRLTAQKDYATLLKAFANLRAKREARLIILGEGEERGTLQQLAETLGIQDDVAFEGFVRNPYAYMRAAALFVLSSRWEGFGNVVVEALACGTAVVSTDCPSGPAEILEKGRWGALVSTGDASALAATMEDCLKGKRVTRDELMKRAADFSSGSVVDEYESAVFGIAKNV